MNWPKNLKIKVNESLKEKNTFFIGGKALFFCEPQDIQELKLLLIAAKENKIPVFILGAGSNILVSDKGVKGLVVRLNSPYFRKITSENNCVRLGCGVRLGELIKFIRKNCLQGLEFLIGIPGTFGGALAMNAGCWGFNIGNLVKEVEIMDQNGKIKTLKSNEINFAYRRSSLAKHIILSGLLKLRKGERRQVERKLNRYLIARHKSQDSSYPNAGCIFKNPENSSAGMLIDSCGLKGRSIGYAIISERHANFILNKEGRAEAKDVLRLMRLIKKRIKDKFNLSLKPEIKIWK